MSYGVLGIIPGVGAANPPNDGCVGTQVEAGVTPTPGVGADAGVGAEAGVGAF